jgi:hypothetical protein
MASTENIHDIFSDALTAAQLVCIPSKRVVIASQQPANNRQVTTGTWHRNVTVWIYMPAGLLLMLLACFGINSLAGISSVSFPASVACMIVLFFSLIICDSVLGDRKTRDIVSYIDIPVLSRLPRDWRRNLILTKPRPGLLFDTSTYSSRLHLYFYL